MWFPVIILYSKKLRYFLTFSFSLPLSQNIIKNLPDFKAENKSNISGDDMVVEDFIVMTTTKI